MPLSSFFFSVSRAIQNALCRLFEPNSPWLDKVKNNEENMEKFVWECVRFNPLVVYVPYYTGTEKELEKRIGLCLLTAGTFMYLCSKM